MPGRTAEEVVIPSRYPVIDDRPGSAAAQAAGLRGGRSGPTEIAVSGLTVLQLERVIVAQQLRALHVDPHLAFYHVTLRVGFDVLRRWAVVAAITDLDHDALPVKGELQPEFEGRDFIPRKS